MSVNCEEVRAELESFGIDLPDEESNFHLWSKIKSLCDVYLLTPEEFGNEWMAYSISHADCELTVDHLNCLDQQVRLISELDHLLNKRSAVKSVNNITENDIQKIQQERAPSNQLLSFYGDFHQNESQSSLEASSQPTNLHQTPKTVKSNGSMRPVDSPLSVTAFSPVSNAKSAAKFSQRTNSRQIISKHSGSKFTSKSGSNSGLPIKIVILYSEKSLSKPYQHMFRKYSTISDVMVERIENLMIKIHDLGKIEEFISISAQCQEKAFVCGQIYSDGLEKLTTDTVFLEDTTGALGRVDLTQMTDYAIFPGQVTIFEGTNYRGDCFVAENQIYCPLPELCNINYEPGLDRLTVLVASGPFTTSDTLNFEPLFNLLQYVLENDIDVLILTGPFLDIAHEQISLCQLPTTFENALEQLVVNIEEMISNSKTQVIMVSSNRDAHHNPIYPCPPFSLNDENFKSRKIRFVPDPCMVRIGGIVFGVTSTDIMFHTKDISASTSNESTDRIKRSIRHLMEQQSFYPFYPGPIGMNLEVTKLKEFASMPLKPQVLITPSNLNHFVKEVEKVVCINPGRLAQSQFGGTFAQITVDMENIDGHSVVDWTETKLIKI